MTGLLYLTFQKTEKIIVPAAKLISRFTSLSTQEKQSNILFCHCQWVFPQAYERSYSGSQIGTSKTKGKKEDLGGFFCIPRKWNAWTETRVFKHPKRVRLPNSHWQNSVLEDALSLKAEFCQMGAEHLSPLGSCENPSWYQFCEKEGNTY